MSNPPLVPIALLPPGIKDARQEALTRVLGDALSEFDIASLIMSDPLTVDAKLLPFMIREFSAQDYIDPEFPEPVQRRILKNIWALQALKGYDAGVKMGLELLGMNSTIEHWHQVEPKRAPNTHRITLMMNEVLFSDPEGYFSPRQLRAANQMIAVTKRHSQATDLRIGVENSGETFVGCFGAAQIIAVAGIFHEQIPTQIAANSHATVPTTFIRAET